MVCCSSAMYLKLCSGQTRSSWSPFPCKKRARRRGGFVTREHGASVFVGVSRAHARQRTHRQTRTRTRTCTRARATEYASRCTRRAGFAGQQSHRSQEQTVAPLLSRERKPAKPAVVSRVSACPYPQRHHSCSIAELTRCEEDCRVWRRAGVDVVHLQDHTGAQGAGRRTGSAGEGTNTGERTGVLSSMAKCLRALPKRSKTRGSDQTSSRDATGRAIKGDRDQDTWGRGCHPTRATFFPTLAFPRTKPSLSVRMRVRTPEHLIDISLAISRRGGFDQP